MLEAFRAGKSAERIVRIVENRMAKAITSRLMRKIFSVERESSLRLLRPIF